MSVFSVYDYEDGLTGYYAQHLENMYEQAMDYLNNTYMTYPSSLIDIPFSEVELAELGYYEAMAAAAAEEIYADANSSGCDQSNAYAAYDLPPPRQSRSQKRIPWGRLVF